VDKTDAEVDWGPTDVEVQALTVTAIARNAMTRLERRGMPAIYTSEL
jgi:hypothetical protein